MLFILHHFILVYLHECSIFILSPNSIIFRILRSTKVMQKFVGGSRKCFKKTLSHYCSNLIV